MQVPMRMKSTVLRMAVSMTVKSIPVPPGVMERAYPKNDQHPRHTELQPSGQFV